jgi:hypothetical protein
MVGAESTAFPRAENALGQAAIVNGWQVAFLDFIPQRGFQGALRQVRNRVYAISAIHELLYRSTSFASIDLANYARHLGLELVGFYGVENRVSINVKGDGV